MSKPFVSYLLIFYNQEDFVQDALGSALAQDYDHMEIIVCDDGSTDGTVERVKSMLAEYKGPHQTQLIAGEHLGFILNVNRVMAAGKGDILIRADGDDICEPNRASKTVQHWQEAGFGERDIPVAMFSHTFMQRDGVLTPAPHNYPKTAEEIALSCTPAGSGASGAYDRRLRDIFGPMEQPTCADDVAYSMRAYILGEVSTIKEPLVKRRIHAGNASCPDASKLTTIQLEKYRKEVVERRLSNSLQMQADLRKALDFSVTLGLGASKHLTIEKLLNICIKSEDYWRKMLAV